MLARDGLQTWQVAYPRVNFIPSWAIRSMFGALVKSRTLIGQVIGLHIMDKDEKNIWFFSRRNELVKGEQSAYEKKVLIECYAKDF